MYLKYFHPKKDDKFCQQKVKEGELGNPAKVFLKETIGIPKVWPYLAHI
jgi:hypothetical protein